MKALAKSELNELIKQRMATSDGPCLAPPDLQATREQPSAVLVKAEPIFSAPGQDLPDQAPLPLPGLLDGDNLCGAGKPSRV